MASIDWVSGAGGWVRNERIFDAAFAPFTSAILDAADLAPGHRVLDVGCGTGTLLDAAVGAGADAVGIDISPAMAEAARHRVPAATVVVADVQETDLLAVAPGAPFDRVVSRFGVMFFGDPTEAFARIGAATAPGGRLAFACWRDEGGGSPFARTLEPLLARTDDPPALPVPGEPGPLGFADPDRVRAVLDGSGWADVAVEALDGVCDFSVDGSDGVEERLQAALSGTIGRALLATLEPALGAAGWEEALDETRAALRADIVDGSSRFTGHTWLVTATRPA